MASAESHEAILEQQRVDFGVFSRELRDDLEDHCCSISGWGQSTSTGLQQCSEDMRIFLDAELQKDIPTGNMRMSHSLSFHVLYVLEEET
jgi:hypothetical protein